MTSFHLIPPQPGESELSSKLFFFFPQLSCPQLSQGQLICLRWFLLEHIKMFWVWDTWAVLVLPALAGPSFQDDLSQCRMWAQAHKSVLPPREVMSWCPFRMLKPLPERSSKGDLKQWPVFSDLNAALFQSFKKMKYPNTWKFLFFFLQFLVPLTIFIWWNGCTWWTGSGQKKRKIKYQKRADFLDFLMKKNPKRKEQYPPKLPQHNCDRKLLR